MTFAFAGRSVPLDELGEVARVVQLMANRALVRAKPSVVIVELAQACHSQTFDKHVGRILVAFAERSNNTGTSTLVLVKLPAFTHTRTNPHAASRRIIHSSRVADCPAHHQRQRRRRTARAHSFDCQVNKTLSSKLTLHA